VDGLGVYCGRFPRGDIMKPIYVLDLTKLTTAELQGLARQGFDVVDELESRAFAALSTRGQRLAYEQRFQPYAR
jgi:hypothetical protein